MVGGTVGGVASGRRSKAGRERRFEDISSGDEDEDDQLAFLRPQGAAASSSSSSGQQKRAKGNRDLFDDASDSRWGSNQGNNDHTADDGFVFTKASGPTIFTSASSSSHPTSSSSSSFKPAASSSAAVQRHVPGAKGPPPPRSRSKVSSSEGTLTASRSDGSSNKRGRIDRDQLESRNGEHRQQTVVAVPPSSAIKNARRSSLLKDGRPAYPHPQISDRDLYRHCSGELQPRERMKHLTSWTLERSRQEMKRGSSSSSSNNRQDPLAKYRGPLLAALKSTLYDLNRGSIQVDWEGKEKGSRGKQQNQHQRSTKGGSTGSKHLPPHPRNEANRKAEVQLQRSLEEKKRQDRQWREAEAELRSYEEENERLRAQIGDDSDDDDQDEEGNFSLFSMASATLTAEESEMLERAAQAIVLGRHDLVDNDTSAVEGEGQQQQQQQQIISAAVEHLHQCGLDVNDEEHQDYLGTRHDPRWQDVEFHADLLRAKSHTFAQLSSLSQQYISAVSARGARALQEMVQGSSSIPSSSSTTSSSSHRLDSAAITPDSSTVGRKSRDNLDKILSTIRSIEDERSANEEAREHHGQPHHRRSNEDAGDISEGEILRVFAGMS